MPRRTRTAIISLTMLTFTLPACGSDRSGADDTASAPGNAAGESSAAPVVNVSESNPAPVIDTDAPVPATGFPVTVTAGNGDVTIESRPERIVVLSASLTEMVFAVGAGDQVIAVDTYSDFPAGLPVTELSGFRPNVEAIGALDPDLVLVSRDVDGIAATLGTVGIQALVLPSATDLDDVYGQIDTVGAATGHTDQAAALVAQMRSAIDDQFARLDGATLPGRFFYEMSDDYKTLTSATFVGSILAATGMVNIADGVDPAAGPYPQLSAEYVLRADPGHLFVAHTDGSLPTVDDLAARPGWSALQALTHGQVTFLDPDIASRWGPRVVELVTAIVDGLIGGS